ncbi:MAG: hypothetical protein A3F84_25960 [Candidatus Handelsmanbacteria bacterium RIFCSPLOWO2_12_FULL_64_10]|uniref:Uncharacterized protein n=1 Tax=Handelsmanbacteria sp. (strain RIFCSPLOWO2_12_FULL_64_10) TaxID=1817868 RepID=A0A1F6CZY8_HANXR|nr:MAG: hypothetical protein A3F84_25960 [Candidatus Handelsmanbacteria bacterium RIFCSPLOWO2_12_FULL_64_10]
MPDFRKTSTNGLSGPSSTAAIPPGTPLSRMTPAPSLTETPTMACASGAVNSAATARVSRMTIYRIMIFLLV